MTRFAIIAALLASPVVAQEARRDWNAGSSHAWIELQPPQAPGATATVTFSNDTAHNGSVNFELVLNGFPVWVEMEWEVDGMGGERITVTPPEGYIAAPFSLTVGEGQTGMVHIFTRGEMS